MSELFVGLMSGTSLDGVDAVLADFSNGRARVLGHAHRSFSTALHDTLLELCQPGENEIDRSQRASLELAELYAALTRTLLTSAGTEHAAVSAIGCHGQTVRHMPDLGYTLQLNAPAVLAERTGIRVVSDFRARDVAAGGQGAPLVPAFHAALFGEEKRRAILNLGGMANLTLLAPGEAVRGFDCGPANALMDAWIAERLGRAYDADGRWAATGQVDTALLGQLLAHPFFAQQPPKSCGREQFSLNWLYAHLPDLLVAQDIQATLAELTARSVAQALADAGFRPDEILVCGGGAYNGHLMRRIAACTGCTVRSTADEGAPPEQVEALAFAWLARCAVTGAPGNRPEVTGARGLRVLGAIWPA